MGIQLRDYQQEMISKVVDEIKKGNKHILLVLPTGAGKTFLAASMIKSAYDKGNSSIFICHRQELLLQTYNTYRKLDITPSLIKSGMRSNYESLLQIALINTLGNRLNLVRYPKIIFWDEAQHISAGTWEKVYDNFPNSIHIGLTATPCRLDGKPLNRFFKTMIETVNTADLIKKGSLVPYLYYAPNNIDVSDVKKSGCDFSANDLMKKSFSGKIIGDNIEQYIKLANGKKNVVFAINRLHALDIVDRYKENGISAEIIDGLMNPTQRKNVVDNFSKGIIKVLVSIDVISEGFDLPEVEVVSLLRPTMSTSLYLQQVGRGLRISPETGKTHAIILDHVNNYQRHGMPDDVREWSLDVGLKKKKTVEASTESLMRCPECFFAHGRALSCPNCGFVYKADNKEIKEVAGELVLIGSPEYKLAQQKEVKIARSLEELVAIEKERGYKFGWAENHWTAKTGEKLWNSIDGLQKIADARGYDERWIWMQKNKVRKVVQ